MKTKGITYLLLVVLGGAVLTGCPPSPDPDPELSLLDPTEVTESGFTVHWDILHATPAEVQLELCCAPDFNEILKEAAIDDPSTTSYRFEGLQGATRYYCRLRITTSDEDKLEKTGLFHTGFQAENADVVTEDGLRIVGDLFYLSSNPPKSPALILMGHGQITNYWKGEELFLDLVAEGYICYIFNYRGHGQSDDWPIPPFPSCEFLEEFASIYALMDMEACYNYLKAHEKVDSTRIGLMGGSLGGIMSLNGNNWPGVKVSVAMSSPRTGLTEVDLLQNVLLTAGKDDYISTCDYWIADECTALYNAAIEPKKLIILEGKNHGMDILAIKGIKEEILEWINARMAE